MMFKREYHDRIARGEITVSFRLWKRSQAKAGSRYAVGSGMIEVEDVQVVPAAMIAAADVPRTGCADAGAVRALAGEHTKAQVTPDTLLYRVQFRYIGRRPTATETLGLDAVAARLARMDARSVGGPWTQRALRLIAEQPLVPARVLAKGMELPTPEFKARVRRLKALGLTVSHENGYELSARAPNRRRRSAAPRSRRTPGRSQ
jgi:hypothetical protein